jgi:O-antigen ligase
MMSRDLPPPAAGGSLSSGSGGHGSRPFGSGSHPVELTPKWMAVYFGAHIVLTVVAQRFWPVATIWALGALLVGLLTLSKGRSSDRLVVVAAYIVGAELVWRGTHARVFWEYGKYALILLLGLSLLKGSRRGIDWRAFVFVACLAPALAVLPYFSRQEVAFNLSGPVTLGLATVFFSHLSIDRRLLLRMSTIALGPIVGLAFLATFGTLRADPSSFAVGGKATTAGIGPNQVSSILGLGLLLIFFLLRFGRRDRMYRVVLGVLAVWLGGQMVLSFSRGGLWTAAGSMVVCALFVIRERRTRGFLLAFAVLGALVFRFVVFPVTDRVSGGVVARRIVDMDLTGREKIMEADWQVFLEHPVFGVGPGQSYGAHAITFRASSAHTEYTRLLAEHGSFGIVAIVMLMWITWSRVRRRQSVDEKGVSLAFTAWALLYMGHSAMRLAAPAFLFGLGGAQLVLGNAQLPAWLQRRIAKMASLSRGSR